MKKIVLSAAIIICSLTGFSQKTDLQPTADMPSKVSIAAPAAPEERIARLEAEIASLKAAQVEMKKQLSEIQSALPSTTKKKKLTVNRVGSKQTSWVTPEQQ